MRVSTASGRDHRSRLTSRTFGLVILLALLFVTALLPLIPHSFGEISESIKSLFVGMTYAQWIGYIAASLGILTFAMQTMIPLRITGIGHSLGQIAFGFLTGIYPVVIQHLILFPLNGLRDVQANQGSQDRCRRKSCSRVADSVYDKARNQSW